MVTLELQRCRAECESVEAMRRTALDSLRGLERELVGLQDTEEQLKDTSEKLIELQAKVRTCIDEDNL